ncbi:MAG: NapC/NirT family cytochrome c [Chloroflexi bacterium]|nr:NapC/NirT family cytochrome c [Chloroflexota bacterium]
MEHRRLHEKMIFLMSAGAIGIIFLVIGVYQAVEFMDSTAFCGRLCHQVMYPEYTTYQASPHSRVTCAECHVGRGSDYMVRSKLSGIPLIFTTLFGTYDRPIPTPVANLRPARDTCEQCHRPGRFSGDLVRVHTTYQMDEKNTKKVDSRILRVGGGEAGTTHDIHWLIGGNVWYLPMDEKRQEIGWVGIENSQGELITEYIDPDKASELIHTDPKRIENEKRLMDCLDCHTRVTHIFQSPEELIDMAFIQSRIDDSLPFIKREGVKALDPPNSSLAEAIVKVEAIKAFYSISYPELYVSEGRAIEQAIEELKEIARLTTFPDMNVSWKTYIDNAGHQKSPGCFRCHSKLVAITGPQKGRVLDASCDSCHYRVETQ